MSISATTRPERDEEEHGREYFFLTEEDFNSRIKRGEFLEHACVFGHLYGTPCQYIEQCLHESCDVVFDIDWQGGRQIKESRFKDNVVSIFILPPSIQELDARLRQRGKDSCALVAHRMKECYEEIKHWTDYDYVLVNNRIEEVFEQIEGIVFAERLKRTRRSGLKNFVEKLKHEFEGRY